MTTYPVGGVLTEAAPRPFGTAPPGASPSRQPVADEVLRQQCAALLQHVYRWIEATAPVAPQVLGVVPMLVTAVQLYEAQEYPACLEQVQGATGVLQQARWAFPALPPL